MKNCSASEASAGAARLKTCPACGYVTLFFFCPICSRQAAWDRQEKASAIKKSKRKAQAEERSERRQYAVARALGKACRLAAEGKK